LPPRHPIVLQFIKGRKRKILSLGQSAKEDEWIEDKSLPSKKHPYQDKLRSFINGKVADANRITLDFESKGRPYSLDDIIGKMKGKVTTEYLYVYFDQVIERLARQGKTGNENVYRSTKSSLQSYISKDICKRQLTM
jgi:hypothetical protein